MALSNSRDPQAEILKKMIMIMECVVILTVSLSRQLNLKKSKKKQSTKYLLRGKIL